MLVIIWQVLYPFTFDSSSSSQGKQEQAAPSEGPASVRPGSQNTTRLGISWCYSSPRGPQNQVPQLLTRPSVPAPGSMMSKLLSPNTGKFSGTLSKIETFIFSSLPVHSFLFLLPVLLCFLNTSQVPLNCSAAAPYQASCPGCSCQEAVTNILWLLRLLLLSTSSISGLSLLQLLVQLFSSPPL